uniref:Alpha 1,4-glycosyltransferase domain-containing protein n=3 Tax=Lygus hesperus TaxID=30085 RepID=A0A0K8SYV7_LYGHE
MRTPCKWHIPCIAVICLTTFVSITYYLHSDPYYFESHANRIAPSTRSLLNRIAAANWTDEIPTKMIFATHRLTESENNVFFIETSCAKDSEKFVPGGLVLTPPQACAIYSTAYHNPFKQVFLIYTCPLSNNFYSKSSGVTKALFDLPNFSVVQANLTYIYSKSPLSTLDGALQKSQYPVEHNADILRILLVYLFGGTYMDLDVVSTKPLDDLGVNYIGAQQEDQLGTGVFNFKAHHPYLKEILEETNRAYDPNAWAAAGPVLATSVLRKVCNLTQSTNLEIIGHIPYCGITVWGYKVFYPIRYWDWALYWHGNWPLVEPMLNETYVVHVWNHMKSVSSSDNVIKVGSEQPYAKLAEQNCIPVYTGSGTTFRRR